MQGKKVFYEIFGRWPGSREIWEANITCIEWRLAEQKMLAKRLVAKCKAVRAKERRGYA